MCHGLGVSISGINDSGDVTEDDTAIGLPFLYCKVLDIHMSSARSGVIFIHNVNSGLVVHIEASRL